MKTLIGLALLVTGCSTSDSDAPQLGTSKQDLTGDNGISLNGISMNGISMNGISMNGISMNGISMNGISMNGISMNGISMNGISMNGLDFIGAQLGGLMSNGLEIPLRIEDIDALESDPEILAYEVSVANGSGGWVSLCGYEADGSARRALPVDGAWDATTGAWIDTGTFSFACRQASIAKCVEFGYKPWEGFGDHHKACVRMLRADYCGDGVAHTVNGTPVNLYDNAGVQTDTESWPIDAEWGPSGALCVNNTRGGTQPSCYAAKYSASCGSFSSGALLVNEYNGQ
jgi:hypothetical protein